MAAFTPERLLCAFGTAYVHQQPLATHAPVELHPSEETAFLELVKREGLAPVVLSVGRQFPDAIAPLSPFVRARLQEQKHTQQLDSLMLSGALVRVLRSLQREGIAAIPFKGPTFAHTYYGDISLRSYGDVDVIVPRERMLHAKQVLLQMGYEPEHDLTEADEQRFLDQRLAYAFHHPETVICIELHWSVLPVHNGSTLPSELIWERHTWATFQEESVRAIDPALYAVYLCAHAAKHRWAKLKWLMDLAFLLRSLQVDERREVGALAHALGFARVVGVGACLLRDVLAVPLPSSLAALAQDAGAQTLASEVQDRWLFDDLGEGPFAASTWFHLREREQLRHRWPFALHSLRLLVQPSEKDRSAVPLPDRLAFLYPLVRAKRLLSVAARRLLS